MPQTKDIVFSFDTTGFIQSTSVNRKLLGGTKFLYEIEGIAV
jgi:hypothetical protein